MQDNRPGLSCNRKDFLNQYRESLGRAAFISKIIGNEIKPWHVLEIKFKILFYSRKYNETFDFGSAIFFSIRDFLSSTREPILLSTLRAQCRSVTS